MEGRDIFQPILWEYHVCLGGAAGIFRVDLAPTDAETKPALFDGLIAVADPKPERT